MSSLDNGKAGTFSRRQWLQLLGMHTLSLSLVDGLSDRVLAEEPARSASLPPLNRFPRMVQEYYVERVRADEQLGLKARADLKNKADAEAYVEQVRKKIQICFGPLPEKTPLKPRITGTIERDTYKIENVIFESRPQFFVTANLYIPKGRKFPLPGVVGSCGHSDNGKANNAYQSFAQGLARLGYVVLIFDPIGQGERLQYGHIEAKVRPHVGTGEHLHGGNQQFLVGEFFGSWRLWDGIRALDYFLTRPEVDPKQVGITGNSGGGTMTAWLCGADQRWSMAAPSCFITTFRRGVENESAGDTEQCPPQALALHLDHDDFLAALAPKPVIVLAKERDYNDVRGAEEAYRRLKRLYTLLGAEDNVKLFVGPTEHGYSRENREAMYQWFNRVTHVSDAKTEPKLALEKGVTLRCTPNGQVAELKSRTLFSFTEEKSKALAQKRPQLSVEELKKTVTVQLRLPERTGVPDYRILRGGSGRKYPKPNSTTYAVETEHGVFALVYRLSEQPHYSRPPQDSGRAILYIAHQSSDAELRDEPLVVDLLKDEPKSTLYTCDVRGIGESRSNAGSDYMYASYGIMLDSPYVGQRTFDVLRVLDWLKSHGHKEVHLAAKGWGSIPATFAALLADPIVVQVTLKNALTSYSAVAESELYAWPLSSFVPGVLEKFDLPDCYRALAERKLRQIEPWGPNAGTKNG